MENLLQHLFLLSSFPPFIVDFPLVMRLQEDTLHGRICSHLVIIVKFRTEKELRVSFRNILLDNRCKNRTHVSISLSIFIFARSRVAGFVSAFQCTSRGPIPISTLFFKFNTPRYPRQVFPEVEYVVSRRRSLIAVLLKVGGGASLICPYIYKTENTPRLCTVIVSYPRTVARLNRTRLYKAHSHRRVCKLVVYVYEIYTRKKAQLLVVIQFPKRRSPSGSAVRNYGRAHPAPCVRPRCVCSTDVQ